MIHFLDLGNALHWFYLCTCFELSIIIITNDSKNTDCFSPIKFLPMIVSKFQSKVCTRYQNLTPALTDINSLGKIFDEVQKSLDLYAIGVEKGNVLAKFQNLLLKLPEKSTLDHFKLLDAEIGTVFDLIFFRYLKHDPQNRNNLLKCLILTIIDDCSPIYTSKVCIDFMEKVTNSSTSPTPFQLLNLLFTQNGILQYKLSKNGIFSYKMLLLALSGKPLLSSSSRNIVINHVFPDICKAYGLFIKSNVFITSYRAYILLLQLESFTHLHSISYSDLTQIDWFSTIQYILKNCDIKKMKTNFSHKNSSSMLRNARARISDYVCNFLIVLNAVVLNMTPRKIIFKSDTIPKIPLQTHHIQSSPALKDDAEIEDIIQNCFEKAAKIYKMSVLNLNSIYPKAHATILDLFVDLKAYDSAEFPAPCFDVFETVIGLMMEFFFGNQNNFDPLLAFLSNDSILNALPSLRQQHFANEVTSIPQSFFSNGYLPYWIHCARKFYSHFCFCFCRTIVEIVSGYVRAKKFAPQLSSPEFDIREYKKQRIGQHFSSIAEISIVYEAYFKFIHDAYAIDKESLHKNAAQNDFVQIRLPMLLQLAIDPPAAFDDAIQQASLTSHDLISFFKYLTIINNAVFKSINDLLSEETIKSKESFAIPVDIHSWKLFVQNHASPIHSEIFCPYQKTEFARFNKTYREYFEKFVNAPVPILSIKVYFFVVKPIIGYLFDVYGTTIFPLFLATVTSIEARFMILMHFVSTRCEFKNLLKISTFSLNSPETKFYSHFPVDFCNSHQLFHLITIFEQFFFTTEDLNAYAQHFGSDSKDKVYLHYSSSILSLTDIQLQLQQIPMEILSPPSKQQNIPITQKKEPSVEELQGKDSARVDVKTIDKHRFVANCFYARLELHAKMCRNKTSSVSTLYELRLQLEKNQADDSASA